MLSTFLALALLLIAVPSWAWTEGTCSQGVSGAVATFQPGSPTGSPNNGDLLVVVVSVTKSAAAVANLSESGGSGTWTDVIPGSTSFNGGDGKIIVSVGTWQNSGFTMPTFALATGTGNFSYVACPYYGYSGVEKETTQTTATSATVNFATETPNEANAEAVFIGAITVGAGSSTWSTNNFLTSCSKNDDLVLEQGQTSSQTILGFYDVNMGPCAAAATGTPSIVYGGTAENNIGLTLILTPKAIPATMSTADLSTVNPVANSNGLSDWIGGGSSTVTSDMILPYVDLWTYYTSWQKIEPNACDEYSWDTTDNFLLFARQLGKKFSFDLRTTYFTPCGITGSPSCTGFSAVPGVPAWLIPSGNGGVGTGNTVCSNSHTMALVSGGVGDFISSHVFKTGESVPAGSISYRFDPQSAAYQFALARMITDAGNRYSAVKNVAQVSVGGIIQQSYEWGLNTGADGVGIPCSGTGTQCNQISGDADWAATHVYATNAVILPTNTSNNSGCSSNPCVFKATTGGTSSGTQPTWSSCTTTCTDGGVTWTNEGQYTALIADKGQYLSLTPPGGGTYCTPGSPTPTCAGTGDSTTCSGSNQPFGVCDMERAYETFESDWHTAFPHAALENVTQTGVDSYVMPEGTITGGSYSGGLHDPFFQDITAHDLVHYPGVAKEINASLNFNSGGPNCQQIFYLPFVSQPALGVGQQPARNPLSNIAGASCNSGTNKLYSISSTDCLIPCIYNTIDLNQNLYYEMFPSDLNSVPDEPWMQLIHNLVWGQ